MTVTPPRRPYSVDDVPHLIDALRDRLNLDAVTEQLVRNLFEAVQNAAER